MKTSKEWDMAQELYEMIDDLETDKQREFVSELIEYLDPYSHFLEQKSERTMDWLYVLYDYYLNDNEDAFEEWENEDD